MAELRTRATELLRIRHPVVLGGMAGGTTAELVAAVSNAGGLGILGGSTLAPDQAGGAIEDIRARTSAPFGVNLLLFEVSGALIDAVIAARPPVFSSAWAFPDYDLAALFARAHDAGLLVMHMASRLDEALAAEQAGADIVVAQGTEGGGHVGTMGTTVIVRQAARALRVPILAAGGIADGEGLAAMLALGAAGAMLGTRFLATTESPLPEAFKRVITESDGHRTLLTEIPDIASGRVWPGAFARVTRNQFIEDWLGRENELRRNRHEVLTRVTAARRAGDPAYATLYAGQTAGLVDDVVDAGAVVERIVADAVAAIERLGRLQQ